MQPANDISDIQVTPRQIEHLAAQRQIYSTAKRVYLMQFILSVPLAVFWSLLVLAHPSLKAYAAWWGLFVALLDVGFTTPQQKRLRQQAATIQEVFDCEVLQLQWRDLKAGAKPGPEFIADADARYRRKEPEYAPLKDWYPAVVSQVPLSIGRIICQRCNCWWDAELRQRYSAWAAWATIGVVAGMFLLSLVRHLTLQEIAFGIVTPIVPVLIFGLREYRDNNETAVTLRRLQTHAEDLWKKALAGKKTAEELELDARNLQDEIFDLRRKSPPILDWIYEKLKSNQENLMVKGADELVNEALAAESEEEKHATNN